MRCSPQAPERRSDPDPPSHASQDDSRRSIGLNAEHQPGRRPVVLVRTPTISRGRSAPDVVVAHSSACQATIRPIRLSRARSARATRGELPWCAMPSASTSPATSRAPPARSPHPLAGNSSTSEPGRVGSAAGPVPDYAEPDRRGGTPLPARSWLHPRLWLR